ncbi:hypothetical protein [Haloarcula sp. JP-L23]|uniref:hypothetical protein n=1 Tax=Haloarcula sp. JP-L23 TaxID=2716717 RepID=UPI00140F12B9|nr:hypothetical protein G9465_05880 [Haloarcula sp. JP-L23]
MGLTPIHSRTGIDLPLSPDAGAMFLAIGVVVVAVITYDIYRQHYRSEVDRGD